MSSQQEENSQASGQNSYELKRLKLDFFINLNLSISDLQKMLSAVNIIFLLVTKNKQLEDMPELSIIRVESDSVLLMIRADDNLISDAKSVIFDICKLKHPEKLPEDHYLREPFKKLYALLKKNKLFDLPEYCLLNYSNIETLEELEKLLFEWVKKITAINGSFIEERKLLEDKEEVIEIYTKNKKEGLVDCIVSGIMLDGVDLSWANMKDSELVETNLMKANLENATLENANLSKAILIGANFANADLTSACLNYATMMEVNLTESILCRAELKGAYLIGGILRRANISGAKLSGAILSRGDLYKVIMQNCEAENLNMVGTNAIDANFSGSNFTGSDFSTAKLQGAYLNETNMTDVKLLEVDLRNIIQFSNVNFIGADWWNASEISEDLLKYLKTFFPCRLNEEERIEHYKSNYKNTPGEEVINRQNRLLGIKLKSNEPEKSSGTELEDENYSDKKPESILNKIMNTENATLTEEEIEMLAREMLNE